MADEKLRIIIDAQDNASADLKKLQAELGAVDKKTETTGKGMKIMDGLALGAGLAILDMGKNALMAVPQMLEQADAIEDSQKALEAFTGSSYAADAAADAIVEGSNNILTSHEAAAAATKLFSSELVTSAEEAGDLASKAIVLGDAVGINATDAIAGLTTLLQTKSTRSAKEFGLNLDKIKQRTRELKEETAGLTDEKASEIAITEELNRVYGQLVDSGYEVGTSWERLTTKISEQTDAGKLAVSDFILPLLDAQEDSIEAAEENARQIALTADGYESFTAQLGLSRHAALFATHEFYEMVTAQEAIDRAIEASGSGMDGWSGRLDELAGKAGELAGNIGEAKVQILGLTEAELGRKALEDLNREFDQAQAAGGSLPGYEEATRDIMTNWLEIPASEQDAFFAIAELRAEFDEGTLSAGGG